MSKMSDKNHEESLKLRTEVKEYIDRMGSFRHTSNQKGSYERSQVSNGFVNNKEITEYINRQKRNKQSKT